MSRHLLPMPTADDPRMRRAVLKHGFSVLGFLTYVSYRVQAKPVDLVAEADLIALETGLDEGEVRDYIGTLVGLGLLVSADGGLTTKEAEEDRSALLEQRKEWREKKKGGKTAAPSPLPSPENPKDSPQERASESESQRFPENLGDSEVKRSEVNGNGSEVNGNRKGTGSGNPEEPPGAQPKPLEFDPVLAQFMPEISVEMRQALDQLEEPAGQPWTNRNAYVIAGRRPMKKYPNIEISPAELVLVRERFAQSSLPEDRWRHVLQRVEADAKTWRQKNRSQDFANAFVWLTGYALTDALKQWNEEVKIARNGRAHV